MSSAQFDPHEIVKVIKLAFREVAPLILQNTGNIDFENKSDGSPVTEIDRRVEKIIIASVQKSFPELQILGEEGGYDANKLPPVCLIIDPIDGTKSFIKNVPTFTSMAVLIKDSAAIACVIYNPSSDEMYSAVKGSGAYKDSQKLDLDKLPLSLVAYCKGRHISALNSILEPQKVISEIGPEGAGFSFAQVAEGKVAARFCLLSKGHIHDYATGALLVSEAGGAIIAFRDPEFTLQTNSFVACHPRLSQLFTENIDNIKTLEDNTKKH